MRRRPFLAPLQACVLAAIVAACASSPVAHFYTMSAAGRGAESIGGVTESAYSVAVGPVTLPELIDRPQMVVRVAANQVKIVEAHRWAQPLGSEIARVVASDLARLLGDARVSSHTQNASAHAEYRVLLDVQRLDAVLGEAVTIEAQWELRSRGNGTLRTGRSYAHQSVAGEGYDALVAAHAGALESLSRDIAQALRALRTAHPSTPTRIRERGKDDRGKDGGL